MSTSKKKFNVRTLAKIAVLAALAFVLMMFETPLAFVAPPFYKMDLSEIAVLVGGFALGPAAAAAIEALKIVLNLLFTGTSTNFVGEFANFVIGMALVLPAVFVYQKKKDKKHAILGLITGSVVLAVCGVFINYFVMIPAYSYFYHLPVDAIVGMGASVNSLVTNTFTFCVICVGPFNLIKGIVTSVLTLLIYKHISPILHR